MSPRTPIFEQRLLCRRPGWTSKGESPVANYRASGYGKPTDLSFHSGACSGCRSDFTACGTWNGRGGATQRAEAGAALLLSPSSERIGAAMRNASISMCRFSADFSVWIGALAEPN